MKTEPKSQYQQSLQSTCAFDTHNMHISETATESADAHRLSENEHQEHLPMSLKVTGKDLGGAKSATVKDIKRTFSQSRSTTRYRNHRAHFYAIGKQCTYQRPVDVQDIHNHETIVCPMEIDTEFTEYLLNIIDPKPSEVINKTITNQLRFIDEPTGKIFAHPDITNIARHPIFTSGFSPVDYLQSFGYDFKLSRLETDEKLPIIRFDLYGFFLLAELYRMVTGEFQADVNYAVYNNDENTGNITMNRRLTAEMPSGREIPTQYIKMPWVLEINGSKRQVAIKLFDTCAVHGKSNYKTFCETSGVELPYKDIITAKDKAHMDIIYSERPEDFDNYALGDLYNYDALIGNGQRFFEIYKALGIEEYFENPRLTIGATVNNILTSKLLERYGLDPKQKKTLLELCEYGTAAHFKQFRQLTSVYNAKVDGGRCRNNRPTTVTSNKLIADADISGCYGNGLRHQEFPLGRPMVIDYTIKSKCNQYLSLKQFLRKYRKNLVPGLWMARVSLADGYELKHVQDNLISWIPPRNPGNIPTDTDLEATEWWTEDNIGTTKIFTRDVKLAVITEDFIEWLENVCSVKQKAELLDNLYIVTATYYPRCERVDTLEELLKRRANHTGKNTTNAVNQRKKSKIIKTEQECYAWTSVNLGELLVDKLLKLRNQYSKKIANKKPWNSLYKLIINTIYGIMVSPFFAIGNVVVGNNITARARAMAWYMEKSLNGFQTITDGCAFELDNVIHKKASRKLTAEALVEAYTSGKTKTLNFGSLFKEHDIELGTVQQDGQMTVIAKTENGMMTGKDLENMVAKQVATHIRNTFPTVSVVNKFEFEIKSICTSGTFHGSANYKFQIGDEKVTTKMRSYRDNECQAETMNGDELQSLTNEYLPSETFLDSLHETPYSVKRAKTYLFRKILKPSEYKKNYLTSWKNSQAFPGCTVESARLLRECSLSQFTFQTHDQMKSWEREQKYLINKYGQSYETFFTNDDGTINYQLMTNSIDAAIRTGNRNFKSTIKEHKYYHAARHYEEHPELQCLLMVRANLDIRYGRKLVTGKNDNSEE
ncbi:hypothetical protein [Moorena sp. SIO3B2]|uniref:hypothetical protein n=1 Tax=Moorena sp. SIO3B2 TaxID=2607827 RepID=UPI0013C79304|nr:hypothetical protein [Moorena sp. SIO3B2]NEP35392.1 hypothetical protein [Moorena sp. SIO3B2]